MAATRPSPSVPGPADGATRPRPAESSRPSDAWSQRTVSGPVRAGRRTKLLVKHLVRGDIALIDHEDLDRVSAEELIAAGVRAVLNCRALVVGRLPEHGPAAARRSGHPARRPARRRAVRRALRRRPAGGRRRGPGRRPRRRGAARGRACWPAAKCSACERVRAETEARRKEIGEALERFAHNTIEHMREERELLAGRHRAAALRHRLPRPLDARRRARRGATSATCARCARSSATCAR